MVYAQESRERGLGCGGEWLQVGSGWRALLSAGLVKLLWGDAFLGVHVKGKAEVNGRFGEV